MNKAWHAENKLPKSASMAQRIDWHAEHKRECGCRPVPKGLEDEVNATLDERDLEEKD